LISNPRHGPRQHWGVFQLVKELAREYERASDSKLKKTGYNRNADHKPCGRFFRFVKTALGFVPEAHRVPLKNEQIARIISASLAYRRQVGNPHPDAPLERRRTELIEALAEVFP
jgi:hypothetical protein